MVAERFGVDPNSVKRWRRAWREGGEDGLAAKPHPDGKRKLSDKQIDELVDLIVDGPREAGFPTDLETCARVVELIHDRFGVQYDSGHIARMLRQLGFTPQKPRTVAREQDPEAVEHWRKVEWVRIKKSPPAGRQHRLPRRNGLHAAAGEQPDLGAGRLHAGAAFVGPTRPAERDWGGNPLADPHAAWAAASTCSGRTSRPTTRSRSSGGCGSKVRRPLIVVWDRRSVHRSAERRITEKGWKAIEFEYLPAYCPELNPVEAMWSHAKYAKLANFVPDDIQQLDHAVHESLTSQARDHRLKPSFFKTAQLRM